MKITIDIQNEWILAQALSSIEKLADGEILDISDIYGLIQVANMIAAEVSLESYIEDGEAITAFESVSEVIKVIKSLEGTLNNFQERLDDIVEPGVPSYEDIYGIPGDF
ncbi:MAG: hypothetical protein QNJ68_11490 [Microcoleaceae cyanobacterium MO_207.B10]|nr:hypothetical protein [Microcoleaceae cyanobacterium MO_207.B10]